jgi:hypothetical protein
MYNTIEQIALILEFYLHKRLCRWTYSTINSGFVWNIHVPCA